MKKLNRQGAIVMSAGSLAGLNTIPKIARAAGIPYQTLYKYMVDDFGRMSTDNLRSIVKVTRMKPELITEIVRG